MKRFSKSIMGVTLLEVMLVLAIAAMIIVMSVRYYQSATASQQANSVIQQLQSITAAADNLAQSSGAYNAPNTTISNATLEPILPNGSYALVTPWGETISVGGAAAGTYNVTIPNPPKDVCPLIITKLATNAHYSALAPAAPSGCPAATSITYVYKANP